MYDVGLDLLQARDCGNDFADENAIHVGKIAPVHFAIGYGCQDCQHDQITYI